MANNKYAYAKVHVGGVAQMSLYEYRSGSAVQFGTFICFGMELHLHFQLLRLSLTMLAQTAIFVH